MHQDQICGADWSSYINNNNKHKNMYKVWVVRKGDNLSQFTNTNVTLE